MNAANRVGSVHAATTTEMGGCDLEFNNAKPCQVRFILDNNRDGSRGEGQGGKGEGGIIYQPTL